MSGNPIWRWTSKELDEYKHQVHGEAEGINDNRTESLRHTILK